tara:strand:+ start:2912 stop:3724 length:813 start_codon:yes stop_codon:yes gene_type:complete
MKISVVQLNSGIDKKKNLASAKSIAEQAIKYDKPDLIAFPEMLSFHGGSDADSIDSSEHIPEGETTEFLSNLAKKNRIFIHGGSFCEKIEDKYFNTTLAFNRSGEIIAKYRKIHLFDIIAPDGKSYLESDAVKRGNEIISYIADEITIGCSICYDIRFAELYIELSKRNVDLIMVPAAFTLQTGKDHWSTLIKARAIETQSYVAAPGQWGDFPGPEGGVRKNWGHSLIVDPWGQTVAQVSDGIGWASSQIQKDYIEEIRKNMPITNHRVI